jgi:hypothetical protein
MVLAKFNVPESWWMPPPHTEAEFAEKVLFRTVTVPVVV